MRVNMRAYGLAKYVSKASTKRRMKQKDIWATWTLIDKNCIVIIFFVVERVCVFDNEYLNNLRSVDRVLFHGLVSFALSVAVACHCFHSQSAVIRSSSIVHSTYSYSFPYSFFYTFQFFIRTKSQWTHVTRNCAFVPVLVWVSECISVEQSKSVLFVISRNHKNHLTFAVSLFGHCKMLVIYSIEYRLVWNEKA